MAEERTLIDEWSVRDLEDNSSLKVAVFNCSELGNQAKPGLQLVIFGRFVNFERNNVEQWAYKANKQGISEYLLAEHSWMVHEDQYIKVYLVTGSPLKAKVEIKTRSSKPTSKEYSLPFEI